MIAEICYGAAGTTALDRDVSGLVDAPDVDRHCMPPLRQALRHCGQRPGEASPVPTMWQRLHGGGDARSELSSPILARLIPAYAAAARPSGDAPVTGPARNGPLATAGNALVSG